MIHNIRCQWPVLQRALVWSKITFHTHCVGTVPLRQLIYRVLDLPPSMRPLVYDFGQLNNTTERDYIAQIVQYRCQNIPGVSEQSDIINVVTKVLAWSQSYMRKRNVSLALGLDIKGR